MTVLILLYNNHGSDSTYVKCVQIHGVIEEKRCEW